MKIHCSGGKEDNKHIYPSIVKVAQKHLCTLAISVPSERLFSKAGDIIFHKKKLQKAQECGHDAFLHKY